PGGDLPGRGRIGDQPVRVIIVERCRVAGRAGAFVTSVRRTDCGFGKIGGVVLVQPCGRVDELTVGAAITNLEMQMRPRAHARGTDVGDVLPGRYLIADRDVDAVLPAVRVGGRHGAPGDTVLDHDEAAVTAGELGNGNRACGCGEDRRTVRRGEVRTCVEALLPGDRV